jgi:hypothetical protein
MVPGSSADGAKLHYTAVAAGREHLLALSSDGKISVFVTGDQYNNKERAPIDAVSGKVQAIAASAARSAALLKNGSVVSTVDADGADPVDEHQCCAGLPKTYRPCAS